MVPAQVHVGMGVGLTIKSLISAGSASRSPARIGTSSGVLNSAREIGTVCGVAECTAIFTRLIGPTTVAIFQQGVVLIIGFSALAVDPRRSPAWCQMVGVH
ncbi:MAG: hypothetical protein ABI298_05400 [Acidimicrobiales bacterium]